ncbi:penicillin-binding transpeptidase domain-containing protein [Patulibacter defluvii]|uniref:penicillin-binding transpeptidase domain-containing protein n=1 Tax=Patulibacter defluvii TaxID=3095358 RepID=UPI002A7491E5|nr:penicillin-binding transpeptidase domain-containing protein [Patulibacter sp. DM4]
MVLAAGIGGYLVLDARASRQAERDAVDGYLRAWVAQDPGAMYEHVSDDVRERTTEKRFAQLVRDPLTTATVQQLRVGDPKRDGQAFDVPVVVRTRLFGTISGTIRLPLVGSGDQARVRWAKRLTFPGLRDGEQLSRTTEMPARGTILARDGETPIAEGESRSSPLPNLAQQVRGQVDTAKPEDLPMLRRLGVPDGAKVGVSGLERILNPQLIGKPGGSLKAGDRVLKRVAPQKAAPVRSSISLPVVRAAAEAQQDAPHGGGVVVVNSRTGEVLAFHGLAWSVLQPPGSTMKIITAAAGLEDGVAKTTTSYPYATEALGIQNSNQESCGGTLVQSFAHSCNSVFAPMAVKLGSKRFVEMAERFGFNQPPGVLGAQTSQLPKEIGAGDLAQSGIGQAQVQATALQVAVMAATIANGGRKPQLTFVRSTKAASAKRIIEPSTARDMRQLMLAVIASGTGKKAAVPGTTTAGKTGTAELRATQGDHCEAQAAPDGSGEEAPPVDSACGNKDGTNTDAWMAAFAPANRSGHDPIAVGVLRISNFQGGETAAPVASAVLKAALDATGG